MKAECDKIELLSISPHGDIHVISVYPTQDNRDQTIQNKKIIAAFHSNQSQGLIFLAAIRDAMHLPSSIIFWREFAMRYVNALCHAPSMEATQIKSITSLPKEVFEKLVLSIPPMFGAEYCTSDMLAKVWKRLDDWVNGEANQFNDGLRGFISHYLPHWSQIGRVCFHLAENKTDTTYPFAFLVTYATRLGKNSKIQYQPLSRALQEFAGQKNKQALAHLLKPVHEASKRCDWVKRLIDNTEIYHPLAWTVQEAHTFLKTISALDESGIVVRLPDWWKKRSRPKVQVTIGGRRKNTLDVDALLDFNVDVVLNGMSLTQQELNKIFSSTQGLISIRGQWVEVDSQQLKEALAHWNTVKNNTADGQINFIEGMRLLAGAQTDLSDVTDADDPEKNWAYVEAGDGLKSILSGLRNPTSLTLNYPETSLHPLLRPYQRVGVNWLLFLSELGLGACLADDMGLGKTIQVLALLLLKQQKNPSSHTLNLLLLPASLLSNWKAEITRFAPSLKAVYLHGAEMSPSTLKRLSNNPLEHLKGSDLVLTTYGMLLRQPWLQALTWDVIILDEAQAIKNPFTRQTKVIKTLKSRARIALTGTPVENRLGDLWSLFDFLCPGLLGSASRFKQFIKQMNQPEHHTYQPLRQLVQPYILRRLKTDKRIISDLPDKTEVIRWCGLTGSQINLYRRAVKTLAHLLKTADGMNRRGAILAYLIRFKQICNHPSHYLGNGEYKPQRSGKFDCLREICEEIASRQEKVLVFTQFREMTEPLADFLQQVFSQPGLILHGGTAVKNRKKLVDRFQYEPGFPFFVLSLKAAGVGLNLTAANHVIHFDRWWNPAVENQATDRAFRIGQHKNVLVHKFVCRGTIEEKIHQMILDKMELADNIIGEKGSQSLLTELNDEKLHNLVSLDIERATF